LAAFGYGLQRGYSRLVEMDADGSHSPQDLSRLVTAADGHRIGLVIGSRYVPGGQTIGWPARRKALSRAGNAYVRLVTGMPLRDATGGFRVYAANALRSVGLDDIQSRGYSFQVEMAWRVSRVGWRTLEVPITFRERVAGESKMSGDVVAEALWRTTKWGLTRRDARLRARERVLDLVERADFAGSPV
jgi:dolichol-phosphate mannosyltransferase